MERFALASQNPWWIDVKEIYNDEKINNINLCPVNWIPRIFHYFNLEEDVVYTLRGPRQVGKTTLIKVIIKDLIDKGVEGRRIFYWTCDLIQSPREIVELLNGFINTTREIYTERLYIFLDEISTVKNWQIGIKYLYDGGKLKNTTTILTGSHSIDIKMGSERLPGRRGDINTIYDKIFVPMKFSEYVDLRDKELKNIIRMLNLLHSPSRSSILFDIAKGKIPTEIKELYLYTDRISRLFDEYLLTGGIIKGICSYLNDGIIQNNLYATYISATIGDIKRWNKRDTYLSQILKVLIEKLTYPLSWNSIKKDTDIGSPSTVAEYVDILKSSFVLCPLYKIDRSTAGPNIRKNKKIHFSDPFIFHALRSWVYQTEPYEESIKFLGTENKAKLIESILCDHLIRFLYNLNPSDTFDPSRNLFYWSDNVHEVDYIVKIKNDYIPIELKYQNTIRGSDYQGIYSFYSADSEYNGIMISKHDLNIHREITSIPVHLFLLLI